MNTRIKRKAGITEALIIIEKVVEGILEANIEVITTQDVHALEIEIDIISQKNDFV